MRASLQSFRVSNTAPNPHPLPGQPAPLKKDEREVRHRHDIPPLRPEPEDEGVLREADRPTKPSDKPEALQSRR